MKSKASTRRFWAGLATINFVVMLYPISKLIHSSSSSPRFFAELALVGVLFVLGMVDALALSIATA